jgi:ketosteroid isomerase-like protein
VAEESEAFELSRRAWVYVEARDLDGFLEIIDEDVEFVSLVAEAEGGGRFEGHEGVRLWWEQVGESLGGLHYEPKEMRDLGGDAVLTELLVSGTVAGVEIPQTMWHAAQVRDGKAVWWGSFRSEQEALESLDAFRARSEGQ